MEGRRLFLLCPSILLFIIILRYIKILIALEIVKKK